jgi:hypothetical protein
MRPLPIVMLMVGCASAGKDITVGGHADGGFNHGDGQGQQFFDAPGPSIDAPPGQQSMTLVETTNQTVTSGNAVACQPPSPDIGTTANSYYRVFDLSTFGITTAFHVSKVSFQVEDCESGSASCTVVAARVGTYTGNPGTTLSTGGITILGSNANVTVPLTTTGENVDAPITNVTIPAGSKMIAEIDSTDGTNTFQLFIGSNTGGQTAKSYLSAPACAPPGTTPTDADTLAGHAMDILLTVTGTY